MERIAVQERGTNRYPRCEEQIIRLLNIYIQEHRASMNGRGGES